jgi:putative two-component system response regulator
VLEAATVFVAGFIATFLGARFGPAWAALAATLLAASGWGAAVALLAWYGTYVSPLVLTMNLASVLAGITAMALIVERRSGKRARQEQGDTRRLMLQTLLSLVEMRDGETGRHSRRTQEYTRILATALAGHPDFKDYLTPERITLLATLAPLHDIGKVGVPDRVLNKPGSLTPDELTEMRKHPGYGLDVIAKAERASGVRDDATMALAKELVYTHHEKWDGTGYPQGLRGRDIPIPGRLLAVVDLYDAMRSPRPYHRAQTHDEMIDHVVSRRGTQFDPDVVDAWLRVAPLFKDVAEEYKAEQKAS